MAKETWKDRRRDAESKIRSNKIMPNPWSEEEVGLYRIKKL
jgi:hypothetical protein